MKIGVLALQGGFACHIHMLHQLGISTQTVKSSDDLKTCDALILPGGESTVMKRLMEEAALREPFRQFARNHPVFGTCAGMILMAQEGVIDLAIQRNAYGTQAASFTTTVVLHPTGIEVEAIFIRAPRIQAILSKDVEILASFQGDPVLIRQGIHYAASFHPELTSEPTVHLFFLNSVIRGQAGSIPTLSQRAHKQNGHAADSLSLARTRNDQE